MATTPEQDFINQELASFATYLVDLVRKTLVRRRIRVNDELLQSLATKVAGDTLQFRFRMGGRFTDMGAGRYYHKGQYIGNRVKDLRLLKGRKAKKWYSRLAYGAVYGTLVNNLQNKYIAAAAEGVRNTLED